jgi:hypothetical protein
MTVLTVMEASSVGYRKSMCLERERERERESRLGSQYLDLPHREWAASWKVPFYCQTLTP